MSGNRNIDCTFQDSYFTGSYGPNFEKNDHFFFNILIICLFERKTNQKYSQADKEALQQGLYSAL